MSKRRILVLGAIGVIAVAIILGAIWQMQFSGIAIVKARVKASLKDPDSARFEHVAYYSQTDAGCGIVNAKNSLGGYVGSTRFVALTTGEVQFEPPDDNTSSLERQLEAVNKRIAWLKLAMANCPEPN